MYYTASGHGLVPVYTTQQRILRKVKGFASATIKDMKCLSYGSMPDGKMSVGIMVGSQTKDPQRMVDFINWLYSPEGIEASSAQSGGNCTGRPDMGNERW